MGWLGKMAKFGLTPWGANVGATLAGTTNPILVLERDKNMDILRATGTEVPTSTTSGYAKGCLFIDRNVTTGTTGLYENIGTNTSCNFNAIGAITAGEIALATGSILLGTAGVAAALDAKGDAKILVGNGTTVTSVSLSQDLTITNAGVVTIAKINNLATAAEVNQVCDGNTATAAEISQAADLSAQVMAPGAGITAGVGTVFKTSVVRHGDIIKTTIFIDLTGLASTTTADDIIGTAGVSHIGQITAALNGTLAYGQITCLETPAGGDLDIDFWSATEGTGAYDALVTDLTEVIMRANGGNWAAGAATQIAFTNVPAADKYMYMAVGSAGGAPGTYTAGQFLIELYGF